MYRTMTAITGTLSSVKDGAYYISFDFYGEWKNLSFEPYNASMKQILSSNIGKRIYAYVELERNEDDWQDVKGIQIINFNFIEKLDKEKVEKDFKDLMNKLNVKGLTETIINMRHEEE